MSLRQLPGALILGLLASLVAHAAGFGSSHVEGGPFHDALLTLALAGAGSGLIGAIWMAFGGCGACAQGSVLASRLGAYIPAAYAVALTGIGWFASIELLEPAHAGASLVLVAAAMLLAAVALRALAVVAARVLSRCALAIATVQTALRFVFIPRRYVAPSVVSPHLVRRIVTRPPPARVLIPA